MVWAALAIRAYYGALEYYTGRDLDGIEKTTDVFKTREEQLKLELKGLDGEVSEIAGLYELTRAMSTKLLFEEIFTEFSDFLGKNFRFASCSLMRGQKVYTIAGLKPSTQEPVNKQIPLMSQEQVIGIINVEGLEKTDTEKFMIVARQFSLEMKKAQLYETVQELAITDGLTGVYVRRYFIERFMEELQRASAHRTRAAFMMIDLDYFKETNDRFGHLIGDTMLRDVARVLKQNVREVDFIGRYGGEEFCVLLPETDKAGAARAAERLRSAVAFQEFMIYDEIAKATISVGVSVFPDDSEKMNELIEFADKALYQAKAGGRNKVVMFNDGG
jgi:diguanylate cyclase (GGDEF)-like protein